MRVSDIRFAEAKDEAVLAELLLSANQHYWGTSDGAEGMTKAAASALIDGRSGCRALIARVDGQPAAFATLTILHPALNEHGTLFMKDLFVVKAARGLGVGHQIMLHLAKMAYDLGCQRFDWTAERDNPKALEFYDALGADRVDEKVYFRFSGDELSKFAKMRRSDL